MENAAKALLIAGGILIVILLLTLFAYLFGQMSSSASSIYSMMSESDITNFNQPFLNYNGRDNLSILDVVTIINLAKSSNDSAKVPQEVNIYKGIEDWTNKNTDELLKNYIGSTKKFKCESVTINPNTKLVSTVRLQQLP